MQVGVKFDRYRDSNKKKGSPYRVRTLSISDFITMPRAKVEEVLDSIEQDTNFAIDTATEHGKTHSLYVHDDMMYEGKM